ncbi:MAG: chemotaxis protein CheW [Thermoprotei archaeon]|nr:chemotaxis protein CheW [Thermoprotei archaeon]
MFKLGKQMWGIDLKYVREVVRVKQYTIVPTTTEYVLGVFNLRGQIVPLLDISKILNVKRESSETAIILNYNEEAVGFSVDNVVGVISVSDNEMLPPPTEAGDYVKGVLRRDGELISILDTERVLETIEQAEITQ